MKKLILLLLFIPLVFSCTNEPLANYTLTVNINPEDGGFVNPDGGIVPEGQQISLTATPADEFIFDSWSGAATGTSSNVSVIMDANKTVTAKFIKKKYTLNVNVEGEGTVAEKVIKAGAATDYISGTIVELTATAETGWEFKEWIGDLTGSDNPKEITIDKAKTVTAVFEEQSPFYLDENGVTIKARDGVTAGTTGELNGVTYTAVNLAMLQKLRDEGEDLSKVVTTLVTDMRLLFNTSSTKNYDDFNDDISSWDVSNVTDMASMFASYYGKFNQDISKWDVSNVTDMQYMFVGCNDFNQDISEWDVSKVTNMYAMFVEAYKFNQDISNWDVSSVTNMSTMFMDTSFNQPIGSWDVSNVTKMDLMFIASSFNQPIGEWDTSNVVTMNGMFNSTPFNQPIGEWDTSNVVTMNTMFGFNKVFNQDISKWDVSNVESMETMFFKSESFNQPIGEWDVSNVKNMSRMFNQATSFNQDLTKWCVSNITSEPSGFSYSSPLTEANKPVWGTCPSESTIWNGTTIAFTKADGANPEEEANQDRITDNIWITRGNDGGQIFNIKTETSYNKTDSPVGTKWAVGTLDEIETLTFKKFRAAVEKPNSSLVGKNLVMYLEEDDIYLSLKFTSWSEQKNGGFAYERSTKP
jgi:surface protein